MSENVHEVMILGSGPAGLTAAVYTARANLKPLLLHGPMPGGQLTTTTDVENFPGFPEGVMGPDLMMDMEKQAKRFGAEIKIETVDEVDLSQRPFTLKTSKETYKTQTLIIATGASPRLLGLEGEKTLMGHGVSTCATCDGAFFRDKKILVIGGGDSACEEANFLTRFGSKVYVALRRDEFRASKIMAERVQKNEKIEILYNHELKDIHGEPSKGVHGVTLYNNKEDKNTELEVSAVFIAIGHIPNTKLFTGVLDQDENGYLVTKANSTKTNIEGVFACGDVQDHEWRQAITAAGTGCMSALEAERWLEAQE